MKIGKEAPHLNLAVGRRDGGVLMSDLLILDASSISSSSVHFVELVVCPENEGEWKKKWETSGKVIPAVKPRLRRSWGCMILRNAISYINNIYNCPYSVVLSTGLV